MDIDGDHCCDPAWTKVTELSLCGERPPVNAWRTRADWARRSAWRVLDTAERPSYPGRATPGAALHQIKEGPMAVNPIGVVLAVVAAMIIGAVYYAPPLL